MESLGGGSITGFIAFIVDSLLGLLVICIIANAIMSWLVAFDVVNYRNGFVRMVGRTLDMITAPILAPLRKIIPSLGGLDITPVIALLIIQGVRIYLLPLLWQPLYQAIG
jgi:YggT family protein